MVSTINVGINPYDVSVNPNTNKAYVANWDDNTVSVIDGRTNKAMSIKS
jgi:DNA-binding beta-propeller fold protein YncE